MYCSLPGSSIHGIFQAKYWIGVPFPSPGDLPDSGIEPGSPTLQADAFYSEPPGKPIYMYIYTDKSKKMEKHLKSAFDTLTK